METNFLFFELSDKLAEQNQNSFPFNCISKTSEEKSQEKEGIVYTKVCTMEHIKYQIL